VQPGQVFAPIHWTGETAPSGRIDDLVAPETDPISGQPESKASVVSVQKMQAAWYGFAVSTRPMQPRADYWALAPTRAGYRVEMAGYATVANWEQEARRLFDLPKAEAATILDPARGIARIAMFENGRLLAALFVDSEPVAVVRDYLSSLPLDAGAAILTGRPPGDMPDPGPMICSCFGVGINTIVSAIETQNLVSVEAIGSALQAGTNCGSCRSELAAILNSANRREAAE
jgi:assimilatory nitrate reductase catalytic subunit